MGRMNVIVSCFITAILNERQDLMGMKYYCTNKNCSYPGETRFEMKFKSEYIMDNNNLASTFCPFCRKEMTPLVEPDDQNDSADSNSKDSS
jgi:hypothetical protein